MFHDTSIFDKFRAATFSISWSSLNHLILERIDGKDTDSKTSERIQGDCFSKLYEGVESCQKQTTAIDWIHCRVLDSNNEDCCLQNQLFRKRAIWLMTSRLIDAITTFQYWLFIAAASELTNRMTSYEPQKDGARAHTLFWNYKYMYLIFDRANSSCRKRTIQGEIASISYKIA